VVDTEIGAIGAQFLGSNRKINGLQKRIRGRAGL